MISPHLIIDLMLFGLIVSFSTALCICLVIIRKAQTKPLWAKITIALSSLFLMFVVYGIFIEPNRIILRTETLNLNDFSHEAELILISDLHLGRFNNYSRAQRAIKKINNQKNDYPLLILGDIVNNTDEYLDEIDILKEIKNRDVYFVYGNHDYTSSDKGWYQKNDLVRVDGLAKKITSTGVRILENEKITLKSYADHDLILGGIDSMWAGRDNYEFIEKVDREDTLVLMCHNPDCLLVVSQKPYKQKVDLVISGHTHGGEMRLPIIGSISPVGVPTQLPKGFDKGYNQYQGVPVYITSGTGSVGVRMRTFNPPEIVNLKIK